MLSPTSTRGWRVLAVTSAVLCALNANAATENAEDKAERIEVTGSRIKRTDMESASPITVITFEDMQREGHSNVADVLNSLSQATGSIQGEQFTNSFTPNAQMVNLRGMGPGYTLVLLNGKRMADYPLPFNGQSNLVNLASIPTAIIERIDILAGGASSIYGSDAVAGVVNIITRKDLDSVTAYLRVGDTKDGGGASQRLQVIGGTNVNNTNFTFAYEYFNTDPIYGKDRSYTDSMNDNPTLTGPADLSREMLILDAQTGRYVNISQATCDKFTDMTFSTRTAGAGTGGTYCGRDSAGDETLRGQRDWHTFYGSMATPVGDSGEFKITANLWQSQSKHDGFRLWWGSDFPYLEFDPGIGDFTGFRYLQRVWQPSETGEQSMRFDEKSASLSAEYDASFGDYDFSLAYTFGKNNTDWEIPRFKAEAVNSYFLGDDLRSDFGMDDFPLAIYAPNYDNFLNPATPAQAQALMGMATTKAESSAAGLSATLSGDLFDMPAGTVQFAAVLEAGTQKYDIALDDRLPPGGQDWYAMTMTGGGGKRDRVAVGAEFVVPLSESLTLTPSTRYDKYDDETAVDDAVTYGLGLEYRPTADLLLRANYQTSFRAPDMHYVYAKESGFYNTVVDFVQCWEPVAAGGLGLNATSADCANADFTAQVFGTRSGDFGLKEEEGKSLTVGMVWEIAEGLSTTIDYYDIDLSDAVNDQDLTTLMTIEAECHYDTGRYAADECARVDGLVQRYTSGPFAGDVYEVAVKPINTGRTRQRGIDSQINYRIETASWGTFKTTVAYTHVLETWRQLTKESKLEKDFRDDLFNNGDRRSNVRAALLWNSESWDASLLGHRSGSVSTYDSKGRTLPWMTYNVGVGYSINKDNRVGLSVVNVTNRRPPEDKTHAAWPYYNAAHYNAVGREMFVEYAYTF